MQGLLSHVIVVSSALAIFCACIEVVSDSRFSKFGALNSHSPKLTQGTELVLFASDTDQSKKYHLEDFFWTGSGDGSSETDTNDEGRTQISPAETSSKNFNQNLPNNTKSCFPKCEDPVILQQTTPIDGNVSLSEEDVDHQFWLVTILRGDGKYPSLSELKDSLEKLYKTAFKRHQEQHLGIQAGRFRRQVPDEEPVSVHIHDILTEEDEEIKVLYHVSVSGQPVIASVAADDMKLVSDNEVVQAIGYSPVIKAEPYLKSSHSEYLSSAKKTWLFIGVALAILFVLLLFATLLTLSLSKKKSGLGSANRRQVFEHSDATETQKSFIVSDPDKKVHESRRRSLSPTYINYKDEPTTNKTFRSTGSMTSRPQSTTNSISSSESSLDISPLMAIQKKRKMQNNRVNIPRPKGALNRTAPIDEIKTTHSISTESDSTSSNITSKDLIDTVLAGAEESGILSPKSYLSMPSVKSFPRSNIPDPLNKILQPVSVLHLDMIDDNYEEKATSPQKLLKSNSMSAMEDPGFIGPIVWDLHRKGLQGSEPYIKPDTRTSGNAAVMRKRFHDLLDDTFTLFGSRRESSADSGKRNSSEGKSRSAISLKSVDQKSDCIRPRPKTSEIHKRQTALETVKPKGAWNSHTPSPLTRPVSAVILKKPPAPEVNVDLILAEGALRPDDPAVALIETIKKELKKCSLPGSTTNLAE